MTTVDALVEMIVDIVSQDYETFQMIEDELSAWAVENSLQLSDGQFRNALASAVQQGLIQAFMYQVAEKFEAVFWNDLASKSFYYLATKQGLAALK